MMDLERFPVVHKHELREAQQATLATLMRERLRARLERRSEAFRCCGHPADPIPLASHAVVPRG